MECKTISHVNKSSKAILKNKKKYKTKESADKDASLLNNLECVHTKKVVYKCNVCGSFHIGSSEISLNKPFKGVVKKVGCNFSVPKVVGFLDLNFLAQKQRTDREIEQVHFEFLRKYNLI